MRAPRSGSPSSRRVKEPWPLPPIDTILATERGRAATARAGKGPACGRRSRPVTSRCAPVPSRPPGSRSRPRGRPSSAYAEGGGARGWSARPAHPGPWDSRSPAVGWCFTGPLGRGSSWPTSSWPERTPRSWPLRRCAEGLQVRPPLSGDRHGCRSGSPAEPGSGVRRPGKALPRRPRSVPRTGMGSDPGTASTRLTAARDSPASRTPAPEPPRRAPGSAPRPGSWRIRARSWRGRDLGRG
jgi:hypothetical protein